MKKFLLLLSIALLSNVNLQAQDGELEAIRTTLNYYLDGGTNNDFEMLKKAFHPNATMKSYGENYQEYNALDFFGSRMKPGPKQDRKTKIVSVSISGTAANAKLEIAYPTFSFIDYMNLLKIDGEWKIVGKIYYKEVKNTK